MCLCRQVSLLPPPPVWQCVLPSCSPLNLITLLICRTEPLSNAFEFLQACVEIGMCFLITYGPTKWPENGDKCMSEAITGLGVFSPIL